MKILIVNTSDSTGGAAVAASRLMNALNNNGHEARMFVRDKLSPLPTSVAVKHKLLARWHFYHERLKIFWHLGMSKQRLWEIDIANCGNDIIHTHEFREADVVHLHWVNQGMLSLKTIRKIIESGKPLVWTMHDLWPATAICHYARGCEKFMSECKFCQLLPGGGKSNDLSNKVWRQKMKSYGKSDITFVTCSHWLGNQAKQSALLDGMEVQTIPNPINTDIFHPLDKVEMRKQLGLPTDKKVILFVAQKVTDERKGARYLVEALNKLRSDNPEIIQSAVVALLGGNTEELASQINMPVHALGYVRGDENLARVYSAADVFVLPSMEDNLPNTLMEAMACGVPCVGFSVGGIPEMIDHMHTGYVAKEANSDDLAAGLRWILAEADAQMLSDNALSKVAIRYSEQSVSAQYVDVYKQAVMQKGYGI